MPNGLGISSLLRSFVHLQPLLEEAAIAALAVDEVDFVDPAARAAAAVRVGEAAVIAGVEVILPIFALDDLVREIADQMAGVPIAIIIALRPGGGRGELVHVGAGDRVAILPEMVAAGIPGRLDRVP